MSDVDQIIMKEYKRFQAIFPDKLLGFVQIGSRSCGEEVHESDHDFRIIIHTDEPYRILQEHAWTTPVNAEISHIRWSDINHSEGVTFGVTNLGFIARHLDAGRFPLGDHTALYQGRIFVDENQAIQSFCDRYTGRFFPNIIDDYLRQTEWRVNNRLTMEADLDTLRTRLDSSKWAIPMIHTCCRIMRDIAHIDTYRQQYTYVAGFMALDRYYRDRWPDVYPWFRTLFSYKMDEGQRKDLFALVEDNDPAGIEVLRDMQDRVVTQWNHFRDHVC